MHKESGNTLIRNYIKHRSPIVYIEIRTFANPMIQRSGGLFGSLEVCGVEVCSFVGLGGLLEVRRLEGVEV